MGLWDAIGSIGGAALGGAASLYGSSIAADAQKKAGQLEWQQYLQSRRDYKPWLEAGTGAINSLKNILLGGGSSDYLETPGYQFRLQEGVNALDRSASARGMLDSGAQRKALLDYGQSIGTDEYNQRLNRLGTLAGFGSSAMGQVSNLGSQAATGYGNALANSGYIRGSSYPMAANTLLQGGANALRSYYY